jgi:uncharacterized protein with PQ loop repeat
MENVLCGTDPTSAVTGLGVVLTVGTAVSYMFQVIALIREKSTAGVSMYSLLLQLISSGLTLSIVSVRAIPMIECILEVPGNGLAGAIPLIQGLVSYVSITIIVVTFFYVAAHEQSWTRVARDAATTLVLFLFFALLALAFSTASLWDAAYALYATLSVFGIFASVCTCVVWIPQLKTTISHRGSTSLSYTMLGIQLTGNIVLATYFSVLIRPRFPWYMWLPYLVNAFMQGTILFVGAWRAAQDEDAEMLNEARPTTDETNIVAIEMGEMVFPLPSPTDPPPNEDEPGHAHND